MICLFINQRFMVCSAELVHLVTVARFQAWALPRLMLTKYLLSRRLTANYTLVRVGTNQNYGHCAVLNMVTAFFGPTLASTPNAPLLTFSLGTLLNFDFRFFQLTFCQCVDHTLRFWFRLFPIAAVVDKVTS